MPPREAEIKNSTASADLTCCSCVGADSSIRVGPSATMRGWSPKIIRPIRAVRLLLSTLDPLIPSSPLLCTTSLLAPPLPHPLYHRPSSHIRRLTLRCAGDSVSCPLYATLVLPHSVVGVVARLDVEGMPSLCECCALPVVLVDGGWVGWDLAAASTSVEGVPSRLSGGVVSCTLPSSWSSAVRRRAASYRTALSVLQTDRLCFLYAPRWCCR
jgi:hypothetical protein